MSFSKYERYRESGVEWLDDLPEHWKVSRLGYETWVRARLGWKGLKAEEYVDEGYAFLATPNIKGKAIDFANVNFIDQFRYEESPEIKLRLGDILLAKDGSTLGTVNVVRNLPIPATVNSSIAVITPNANLHSVYAYYLFQSSYMEHTIQRIKGGMGVPHLFQEDLNRFYIPLPTLTEQYSIAAFLDGETAKIDTLVEEQRRLIELLKEKRQAAISHAVTKGINANVPMKDSGIEWLAKVPAHWSVLPLSHAISFQEGPGIMAADFRDEGVPLLRVSGVQGRWATLDGCNYLDPEKVDLRWKHFRLEENDLLISASASMGTVCEIGVEVAGAIPYTGLIRLRPQSNDFIAKDYIRAIVSSDLFFVQIDLFKAGATIQHYGPTHLSQMKIVLPPMDEQLSIVSHIAELSQQFDELLNQSQTAVNLLKEYRTSLISAAVTGKINVLDPVQERLAAE